MLPQESFYFTPGFYNTRIHSILEFGSPVFHRALSSYLSEDLERLPKRAMKIIYPELSYVKALQLSGLWTLYDRRDWVTAAKLFDGIYANQSHSLHKLLPSKHQPSYYERNQATMREQRTFIRPKCKTERCKNSFLLSYVYSSWELDIVLFLIVYRNSTHAFEFVIPYQFFNYWIMLDHSFFI